MINCSIGTLLPLATARLTASDSALLDAQLLMAYVLQTSRTALLTWPERQLNDEQLKLFEDLLCRREQGEPIAYLTGLQPFWQLELKVSSAVLVPRPETELIVEWALQQYSTQKIIQFADLGTGSGAIALAVAAERTTWLVTATDIATDALAVAMNNAKTHGLNNVAFYQGNWCAALPDKEYDIIVSNPPYIAATDPHLLASVLRFEPRQAVIANKEGYADLFAIAEQAPSYLRRNAPLVLEHGFTQGKRLRVKLAELGYHSIETLKDLAQLERVTVAYR